MSLEEVMRSRLESACGGESLLDGQVVLSVRYPSFAASWGCRDQRNPTGAEWTFHPRKHLRHTVPAFAFLDPNTLLLLDLWITKQEVLSQSYL